MLQNGVGVLCSSEPLLSVDSFVPEIFKEIANSPSTPGTPFHENLCREANFYSVASRVLPRWLPPPVAQSADAAANAAALFGPREAIFAPGVSLPWQCKPELLVPAQPLLPPFNGEIKSLADSAMFVEVATYVGIGMLRAFFSAAQCEQREAAAADSAADASRGPAGPQPLPPPPMGLQRLQTMRFYTEPPTGFAVVGLPHVGYLVGVELVGKLFMAPVSQPFFLGSAEHAKAVEALPSPPKYALGAVEVSVNEEKVWATFCRDGEQAVQVAWTAQRPAGGKFLKIIRCTALDAGGFRALFRAYNEYARAMAGGGGGGASPPAALVPGARLLFGPLAVLVEMPWVAGARQAGMDELCAPQSGAMRAVAEAVAWLARRRLLYVDVRPPNVLVVDSGAGAEPGPGSGPPAQEALRSSPRFYLVDYDDIVVVDAPLSSAEEVIAALTRAATEALMSSPLFSALKVALKAVFRDE
jgi:hypothetical protein